MIDPHAPDSIRPATRPTIPPERFAERLARAQAGARAHRVDALLVSVGPDLAYLAGYEAMPLERLTMLVVPADGPVSLVVPRLEAAPARLCPAVAGGAATLVTWEETDDAAAVVRTLLGERQACLGVSDRLTAMHLLRLQASHSRRGVRLRVARPAGPASHQGCRRDRPAADGRRGRRSRRLGDRARPADRAHRGRGRPRGPGSARRRGPRSRRVRDRRLGPQLGLAAP